MVRKGSLKDCIVALRCDRDTKEALESLAESLDMTVSHMIFRLIKSLRKINESWDMVDMTMFFPTPEMIEQDRMLWLERRAAALRAEWLTEIREADQDNR